VKNKRFSQTSIENKRTSQEKNVFHGIFALLEMGRIGYNTDPTHRKYTR